ncbi:putative DNA-binding domain-containing protein [Methyloglobulus sp.]|uniref:HvfC family RiPP maturation protein n=1 Tax=Methyloglobulus sp. TaxID=2518622 RepID=UPI0032B7678D
MAADFKTKQLEFTRYIREPLKNPAPTDVKPERMAMYRELVFNNIESFLAGNFPVIRKILDNQQWFELTQDFFSKHKCKTPYFSEIAEEFLDYLENERSNPDDFPFLLELAHYEWVEMALSIAKEDVHANQEISDDFLNRTIQLSPVAWPLVYQFPVQLISPEYLPLKQPGQPSYLIAYRDQADDVKFIQINSMTYRLLEIIQEHDRITAKNCLKQVAEESLHPNPDVIITGGLQILKELLEKTVISSYETG